MCKVDKKGRGYGRVRGCIYVEFCIGVGRGPTRGLISDSISMTKAADASVVEEWVKVATETLGGGSKPAYQ